MAKTGRIENIGGWDGMLEEGFVESLQEKKPPEKLKYVSFPWEK